MVFKNIVKNYELLYNLVWVTQVSLFIRTISNAHQDVLYYIFYMQYIS